MKYAFFSSLLVVVLSSTAHAGIFFDLLNTGLPGEDVVLEDNSRGLIFDFDDDGLTEGDVIQGIIRIDRRIEPTFTSTLPDEKQLIIVYSFQVKELVGAFGIDYEATTAAGYTLEDMIDTSHQPLGFDWSNAAFAVFERDYGVGPGYNPASDTVTAGASIIDLVVGAGSGYSLQMIGGFADGDFFNNLVFIPPGNPPPAPAGPVGNLSGGLSVLYNALEDTVEYNQVTATNLLTSTTSQHDVGIEAGLLNPYGFSNWDFADKANFRINVNIVPEPASMLVWGGLASALGLGGLIRRRKK